MISPGNGSALIWPSNTQNFHTSVAMFARFG